MGKSACFIVLVVLNLYGQMAQGFVVPMSFKLPTNWTQSLIHLEHKGLESDELQYQQRSIDPKISELLKPSLPTPAGLVNPVQFGSLFDVFKEYVKDPDENSTETILALETVTTEIPEVTLHHPIYGISDLEEYTTIAPDTDFASTIPHHDPTSIQLESEQTNINAMSASSTDVFADLNGSLESQDANVFSTVAEIKLGDIDEISSPITISNTSFNLQADNLPIFNVSQTVTEVNESLNDHHINVPSIEYPTGIDLNQNDRSTTSVPPAINPDQIINQAGMYEFGGNVSPYDIDHDATNALVNIVNETLFDSIGKSNFTTVGEITVTTASTEMSDEVLSKIINATANETNPSEIDNILINEYDNSGINQSNPSTGDVVLPNIADYENTPTNTTDVDNGMPLSNFDQTNQNYENKIITEGVHATDVIIGTDYGQHFIVPEIVITPPDTTPNQNTFTDQIMNDTVADFSNYHTYGQNNPNLQIPQENFDSYSPTYAEDTNRNYFSPDSQSNLPDSINSNNFLATPIVQEDAIIIDSTVAKTASDVRSKIITLETLRKSMEIQNDEPQIFGEVVVTSQNLYLPPKKSKPNDMMASDTSSNLGFLVNSETLPEKILSTDLPNTNQIFDIETTTTESNIYPNLAIFSKLLEEESLPEILAVIPLDKTVTEDMDESQTINSNIEDVFIQYTPKNVSESNYSSIVLETPKFEISNTPVLLNETLEDQMSNSDYKDYNSSAIELLNKNKAITNSSDIVSNSPNDEVANPSLIVYNFIKPNETEIFPNSDINITLTTYENNDQKDENVNLTGNLGSDSPYSLYPDLKSFLNLYNDSNIAIQPDTVIDTEISTVPYVQKTTLGDFDMEDQFHNNDNNLTRHNRTIDSNAPIQNLGEIVLDTDNIRNDIYFEKAAPANTMILNDGFPIKEVENVDGTLDFQNTLLNHETISSQSKLFDESKGFFNPEATITFKLINDDTQNTLITDGTSEAVAPINEGLPATVEIVKTSTESPGEVDKEFLVPNNSVMIVISPDTPDNTNVTSKQESPKDVDQSYLTVEPFTIFKQDIIPQSIVPKDQQEITILEKNNFSINEPIEAISGQLNKTNIDTILGPTEPNENAGSLNDILILKTDDINNILSGIENLEAVTFPPSKNDNEGNVQSEQDQLIAQFNEIYFAREKSNLTDNSLPQIDNTEPMSNYTTDSEIHENVMQQDTSNIESISILKEINVGPTLIDVIRSPETVVLPESGTDDMPVIVLPENDTFKISTLTIPFDTTPEIAQAPILLSDIAPTNNFIDSFPLDVNFGNNSQTISVTEDITKISQIVNTPLEIDTVNEPQLPLQNDAKSIFDPTLLENNITNDMMFSNNTDSEIVEMPLEINNLSSTDTTIVPENSTGNLPVTTLPEFQYLEPTLITEIALGNNFENAQAMETIPEKVLVTELPLNDIIANAEPISIPLNKTNVNGIELAVSIETATSYPDGNISMTTISEGNFEAPSFIVNMTETTDTNNTTEFSNMMVNDSNALLDETLSRANASDPNTTNSTNLFNPDGLDSLQLINSENNTSILENTNISTTDTTEMNENTSETMEIVENVRDSIKWINFEKQIPSEFTTIETNNLTSSTTPVLSTEAETSTNSETVNYPPTSIPIQTTHNNSSNSSTGFNIETIYPSTFNETYPVETVSLSLDNLKNSLIPNTTTTDADKTTVQQNDGTSTIDQNTSTLIGDIITSSPIPDIMTTNDESLLTTTTTIETTTQSTIELYNTTEFSSTNNQIDYSVFHG